jgi:hypothetical protein
MDMKKDIFQNLINSTLLAISILPHPLCRFQMQYLPESEKQTTEGSRAKNKEALFILPFL